MEQSLKIQFNITKENREYTFIIPYGASHGEVYDVAHEIIVGLVEIQKQQAEALKRQEESNQGDTDGK